MLIPAPRKPLVGYSHDDEATSGRRNPDGPPADLWTADEAVRARGGDGLSTASRARRIAAVGTTRAFDRADTLSVALRARCFAWNPTLPALSFSRPDYPVLVLLAFLGLMPLLPF